MRRICVLGLPRTGSNYILSMLFNNLDGIVLKDERFLSLSEPFTWQQPFLPVLGPDGFIENIEKEDTFLSSGERIEYVIDVISRANRSQSLVLKFFPLDLVDGLVDRIIAALKSANFTFIQVKRNDIEHQLISYALAEKTNRWISTDGTYMNERHMIISFAAMAWLYGNIVDFDSKLTRNGIGATTIHYETAITDLAAYLNVPVDQVITKSFLEKQGAEDPYKCIINADEIRWYFEKLLDKEPV